MNDMNINFNNMKYKITCADVKNLPGEGCPEIVISGRSNAGKSSLINALAGNNKLARVSGKPGKTREIIYFDLDGKALVADLPGYGYSAASKAITAKFSDLCDHYFRCGRKISLVLFLMDIRRTPSEEDIGMLNFLNDSGIPYIIVFTKCDKLSNAEIKKQLGYLSEFFDFADDSLVFAVSSKDKKGISDLKTSISDIICVN
jgi:GTP-binding protein